MPATSQTDQKIVFHLAILSNLCACFVHTLTVRTGKRATSNQLCLTFLLLFWMARCYHWLCACFLYFGCWCNQPQYISFPAHSFSESMQIPLNSKVELNVKIETPAFLECATVHSPNWNRKLSSVIMIVVEVKLAFQKPQNPLPYNYYFFSC